MAEKTEKKKLEPTKLDKDLLGLILDIKNLLLSFALVLSLKTQPAAFAPSYTWDQVFEEFYDYIRTYLTAGLLDVISEDTKGSIERLRPMDDLLFRHLVQGKIDLMQKFLQDIAGITGLELERMHTQYDFPSLGGYRGIIADAFAVSLNEAIQFVVEAQNRAKPSDVKRGLDELHIVGSRSLKTGDDFELLPDEYVIFIVDKDIFGENKLLYRKEIVTKDGEGAHLLFLWCHDMDFDALPEPQDGIDEERWKEICTWSNDFVQVDYNKIRNPTLSALVKVAKTIEKGKKVNTLSEELYMEYEMKYLDHTVAKISEAKKQASEQRTYEIAKNLLADGFDVHAVSKSTQIPVDELLSMKADLDKDKEKKG